MVLAMPSPAKDSKTGVYRYRKVVPEGLRAIVGKREIKRSLRTKDIREAKRLFPAVADEVEAYLASLAGGPIRLSRRQVAALAGEWYRENLTKAEADPDDPQTYDVLLSAAQDADDAERIGEFVAPHVDKLLAAKGLIIDDTSREALSQSLFWGEVRLWNTLTRRAHGDYSPDPHLATLPRWEHPGQGSGSGPTFDQLIDGWARETDPTEASRKHFKRYLHLLAEHIGHDDASRVERRQLAEFKDARLLAGKAPKTVATELQGIGAVLSWAAKNEKIPSNPAKGIEVAALKTARRRGERGRYPYTKEEAARILAAAREETRADRRWLPWLCALTGARISEVASVHGRDIREEDGVWFVDIGVGRMVKTASSIRRVPLHPALIAEGFLEYAQSKTARERLFTTNADQNVGRWIREKVGITDRKKGPSHSWRHWFEDAGRAAGIEEDIRDALAGHANPRIGRQYGLGYRDPRLMRRLAEEVAKIPVPLGLAA